MPRGIYDRSKARRRTTRKSKASLSTRIEQLSKELASLSEEVKRAEGLQNAVNQYMQAQAAGASASADGRRGPGRPPGTTGRRRGRPPGSKNRPKTATALAAGVRRGPGRPRKNPAAAAAPRRRGRPRKTETAG